MVIGQIKKIGIALAAFEPNVAFFNEQLESIQNQSFDSWICVVTFDSPMKKVLKEPSISKFTQDQRFRFVENPIRLGHKKNFERALNEVVKGEVDAIACSDQDDVWYPEKLQVCAQYLSLCPPMSLVHSDMHILKGDNKLPQTAWAIEKRGVENVKQHHFFVRNVVAGCSMLMDTRIIKQFPHIPESAEYHDHWYAVVAATLGQVRPVYVPLYAYRQHTENVLAVSPYRGFFSKTESARSEKAGDISSALIGRFKASRQLVSSVACSGLRLSFFSKLLFLYNWDFGLGLGLLALKKIIFDPALARACLARSAGKLLLILNKKPKSAR